MNGCSNPCPVICQFQLPTVNHGLEAEDPPSDISSEGNSGLILRHSAYVIHLTLSDHVGILTSHIITKKR